MSENKKCECSLCAQQFIPEDGSTPEEHLAKGIVKVYREMQDAQLVPERNPAAEGGFREAKLLSNLEEQCPRCGHKRMKPHLRQNALSRCADVYICDVCGTDEALRDMNNDVLPITEWYVVREILKMGKS